MGYKNIEVGSVEEYINAINEQSINLSDEAKLVFRGQSIYKLKNTENSLSDSIMFIKCGAARRIESNKPGIIATNDLIFDYILGLLKLSKMKKYDKHNVGELVNLEVLADLQHFGAATNLIDFTKNALVALFFASNQFFNQDGAIFVMNIGDKNLFEEAGNESKFNAKNEYDDVQLYKYFTEGKYFYWEPSFLNMRIPAQHSIFIFGVPEIKDDFISIIRVKGSEKQNIIKKLDDTYNINDVTLFNDLPGFSWANRVDARISEDIFRSKYYQKVKEEYKKTYKSMLDDELTHFRVKDKIEEEDKIRISNLEFEKGNIEFANKNYEKAITCYEKAIEFNSKNYYIFSKRGSSYARLKKYDFAIIDYTRAIELNPNNTILYLRRGFAYKDKCDYANAIKDYGNAIELNPEDSLPYILRGGVYMMMGDLENSLANYKKAMELDPNNTTVYNNLSDYYMKTGDMVNAEKYVIKSIELDPNYNVSRITLGEIYQRMKKFEMALESFNKAVELDPEYGESYYKRHLLYKILKNDDLAEIDLKKARELGYEPPPYDK
jgi:tetratricopeptide (TPR) repeat protein